MCFNLTLECNRRTTIKHRGLHQQHCMQIHIAQRGYSVHCTEINRRDIYRAHRWSHPRRRRCRKLQPFRAKLSISKHCVTQNTYNSSWYFSNNSFALISAPLQTHVWGLMVCNILYFMRPLAEFLHRPHPPPPSTHTPHHRRPLKTGPSQVVVALWREVGPLCLRGGAAPHMINDLARRSGHETWFIHEGFHLHVSEYHTPVTVSAGCWHTKQHSLSTTDEPSRAAATATSNETPVHAS